MRLSKAEWTAHVERWRSSGSSARVYCEERELKVSSLRYWSSRIRRESGAALDRAFESKPPRFARVQTPKRAASEPRSTLRVVVSDTSVEVPPGFDAETLRRVLEVLRGGR